MKSKRLVFLVVIFFSIINSEVFNGFTLYTPMGNNPVTYLINNNNAMIRSWPLPAPVSSISYLLPDSSLLVPLRGATNSWPMQGPMGGRLMRFDWNGNVLWDYTYLTSEYIPHHDIEPLPNGNVLVICHERKTQAEAIAAGRTNINGEMWPDKIVEIEPTGPNNGVVVWEWHMWDHLIQDQNPSADNYGVIADHPELLDINIGNVGGGGPGGGNNGDWNHLNCVSYNAERDEIVLSSRHMNEFYVIDHSTTTEEAAGHSGGNSGKGGDILYRWGNPQNYDRGNSQSQQLVAQHGVNWINPGFPGAGNFILFNNGGNNSNTSYVYEIVPPLDENGDYVINDNQPFGPSAPIWSYSGGFHSPMQSGAFRLPNGNTFVTSAQFGHVFEVEMNGTVVWEYNHPEGNMIARAQKFPMPFGDNPGPAFMVGDTNYDGVLNIYDLNFMIDVTLGVNNANPPSDYNQDGLVNFADVSGLLNFIMFN